MKQKKDSRPQSEYTGTVKWFRDHLGYGFIECNELKKDIYFHYSRIVSNESFKLLSAGQIVIFEVVSSDKGLMAVNIREQKLEKAIVTSVQQS